MSISQITSTQSSDTLKLSTNQAREVYFGLKQGEVLKQHLKECKELIADCANFLMMLGNAGELYSGYHEKAKK